MRAVYDCLLRLYPDEHRRRFGEEMAFVFEQARSERANQGPVLLTAFYCREVAGVCRGAWQEHLREFSNRRFATRTQFRFPKTTPILMTIILAGVVLAIQKGAAIQASLPDVNPPIVPIHQASHGFFARDCAVARSLLCRGIDRMGDFVRAAPLRVASA